MFFSCWFYGILNFVLRLIFLIDFNLVIIFIYPFFCLDECVSCARPRADCKEDSPWSLPPSSSRDQRLWFLPGPSRYYGLEYVLLSSNVHIVREIDENTRNEGTF